MAFRGRQSSQNDRYQRNSNYNSGNGDRSSSGNMSSRRLNSENPPCKKLYVANFPYHFETDDLGKIFSKYGELTDVNIVKSDNDKRFGFVTFATLDESIEAKCALNNAAPLRLFVNYAKLREENFKSFEEDSRRGRNMNNDLKLRQRSRSLEPNSFRIAQADAINDNCVRCGDKAGSKCSSCGIKYCSPKCQNDDWPEHVLKCLKKPELVVFKNAATLNMSNTQSEGQNKFKLQQPRERFLSRSSNVSNNREPSVNELVKEITNEFKNTNVSKSNGGTSNISSQNKTLPDGNLFNKTSPNISPKQNTYNINQRTKLSQNVELKDSSQGRVIGMPSSNESFNNELTVPDKLSNTSTNCPEISKVKKTEIKVNNNPVVNQQKMRQNAMFLALEQLKQAKAPVKSPWECTEQLLEKGFTTISVVHCWADGTFNAILKEKENTSIEIMTKANDGTILLEHLTDIKIGGLCLVQNQTLKYRGKILSTSPCKVNLLDFGFDVMASKEDLYQAPDYFAEIPAQAMCLKLASGGLSNYAVVPFDYLSVKPTGELSGNTQIVQLENESYDSPASSKKELDVASQGENFRENLNERQLSGFIKNNENAIDKAFTGNESEPVIESASIWKTTVSLPKTYTKVHVTMIDGPDIYVTIASKMEDVVIPLLSNANNSPKKPVQNVSPEMLCLAEFEGLLYRAVIKSVNPLRAYLLDYGNILDLKPNEVYSAPDAQSLSPAQAIHVRLASGSRAILQVEDELSLRTIDKDGTIHIVEVEGEKSIQDNVPPKIKKHAIDYLELRMQGSITINERPCSNKFCLNLNVKGISSLQHALNEDICNSVSTLSITSPSVGDHVMVKIVDKYHRAKVLYNKETLSYVSLIDVGKVVSSNQIFALPERLKEYPPLAVLGTLQPINCKATDLETALKTDKIEFTVMSIGNDKVIVECKVKAVTFVLELQLWEPLTEQVKHGRIYLKPLEKCQVFLTHFIDQKNLFIRNTTPELDRQYEEDLQNVATYSIEAKPLITLPVVNELVLAKFVDGVFYKAIVKKVDKENVEVFYTAYGNTEIVKLNDLRAISENLKKVNLFIRKVALAEVPDLPLTLQVTTLINDIVNSSPALEFTMTPCKTASAQNQIYLMYPEGTFLNEKVSRLITPVWHDIKDMSKAKQEDTLLNQDVLMKNLIKQPEIPVGDNIELFIVDTTNIVLNIFFACVPDKDCLVNMLIEVPSQLKNYATSIDMPYNPRIDELCIALFQEVDEQCVWHRAYCLKHEGDTCYLASVDMGIMQYVDIKNIRRMSTDFLDVPSLSALFSIQGLPEPPLSDGAVKILQEALKSCETTVKFGSVQKEDDGSYSVQLATDLLNRVLSAA